MNVKVHNTIGRTYRYIEVPSPELLELDMYEKSEFCPSCGKFGQHMFFVENQVRLYCSNCNIFYKIVMEEHDAK